MGYTLELAQQLTLMKNIWEVRRTDQPGAPFGRIEQARMKLREHVTCTSADGSQVLFTIRARNIIEIGGVYDIADGGGVALGTLKKDFAASLGRSTYQIETANGRWTVTETSQWKAIARRIVNLVTDIPWLFRVQFVIINEHGVHVGHINRANMRLRDTYEIHVGDDRLDYRVATAAGVAVDAFMNR